MENGISLRGGDDDGHCGPYTVQSIKKFQLRFMRNPDGRVDAGGRTWKRLTTGISPFAPNVGTSASVTALTPVVTPQVSESPASSGGNVEKLFRVMRYITKYRCTNGFSNYDTDALIQRARNCDEQVPFITNSSGVAVTKVQNQSINLCASYVKMGLAGAEYVNNYINCNYAKDMGQKLIAIGFTNIVNQLFNNINEISFSSIPNGAVIVYEKISGPGSYAGHIEIFEAATKKFMSDFITERPASSTWNDVHGGLLKKQGGSNNRVYKVIGIWKK
jgi:hypothetical protein